MSTDQPRSGSNDPDEHPTEAIDVAPASQESTSLELPREPATSATQQFETAPYETQPYETPPAETRQFEPRQFEQPSPQDSESTPAVGTEPIAPAGPAGPAGSKPSTAASAGSKAVRVRATLRVGTVVWGLVLAIIGACLLAIAAGAQLDLELVSIALLTFAGIGLLVGSIVTSSRRRSRDPASR